MIDVAIFTRLELPDLASLAFPVFNLAIPVGNDWALPVNPTVDPLFTVAKRLSFSLSEQEISNTPYISVDFNANPVTKFFSFNDGENGAFLMAVSAGKLYQVTPEGASFILDLFSETVVPSFLNYNGRLLIADGSPHLRWFDGQSIGTLSTSPAYATALAEIGNRVACNSGGSGEMDTVYFSAPEDDEDWDTAANAVGVRAGYLDGLNVTALGVLGTDLMVFKGGAGVKRVYRISTSGTPADWYTQLLSTNATALSPYAVEQVGNDLWFADDTGIKAFSQVQSYGDLAMGMAGMLIEPAIQGKQVKELTYLPSLGVLAILVEGTPDIFLYHPHNKAYTTWNISEILINSVCESDQTVYLAGNNGYLYRLGIDDVDELTTAVTQPVTSRIEGRQYIMPREGVIRRSRLYYDELTPTEGLIGIVAPYMGTSATETKLADIVPVDTRILSDATNDLAVANLSLAREQHGYVDARSRYRSTTFSFVIRTTKGRVRLKNFSFDVANVDG